MLKITYANSVQEVLKYDQLEYDEIIVSTAVCSRFLKTSIEEFLEIIKIQKSLQARLIFEWDTLSTESIFKEIVAHLEKLPLFNFASIRVQDPGAMKYVFDHFPWMKLQLILETGNHNLHALYKYEEIFKDRLERIILSNEVSRESLRKYGEKLKTPIEILVYGPILLFYSPRKLISPLEMTNENGIWYGSSEESPHSGFPIIENRHGTFMFNVKDLSLLDHLAEIEELKVAAVRFDFRLSNEEILKGKRPLIKGLYQVNKTNILFSKLKNKKRQRIDENYWGEVVDVLKDEQLCLKVLKDQKNILLPLELDYITPEGKEKTQTIHVAYRSDGSSFSNEAFELKREDLFIIPYLRGVTVRTQVYRKSQ